MTTPTPTLELDIEGPGAPPRSNGELVFAEPWEGRAFGLTMALVHAGTISYETFRGALIEQIATWQVAPPPGDGFSYYRCWLEALEQVVDAVGLVSTDEVEERSAAFADRPSGHDHRHEHGHGHDHDG
jgi:nitrile hydratase accessory protein